MPTQEDTKVFDIARPIPVINGHRPQVGNPAPKEEPLPAPERVSTPIHVAMDDEDNGDSPAPDIAQRPPEPENQPPDQPNLQNVAEQQFEPQSSDDGSGPTLPPLQMPHGAGPKRRWPKILAWLLVGLIVMAVAGYLSIDAGLLKSNIKLPFHIFNLQKTSNAATTSNDAPMASAGSPTPIVSQPSIPTGFTAYTLSGTGVSFDYPTAWGVPTVTNDPGFSQRSTAGKSDGAYAYLVNFATNKDVQMAFTSSKYLPAVRAALYYDFLQWCVGTNDGKFYEQSMHFTTVAGVDTPANIVCDQGPLNDATKIDNQTIVQLNTKDATGKVLGDLYTKNLTNVDPPVLRIKDAAMANGDDIKTLLTTVKVSSSASSSSSSTTTSTP